MAMTIGQARVDPVTGLAGRIYNALIAKGYAGLSPTPEGSPARDALAAICEAIAEGVYDELTVDARVAAGRIT